MQAEDLFCHRVLLADGWHDGVTLRLDSGGMIRAVDAGRTDGCRVLEGPVLPGMPNLHSHGFQALIAGLTGQRGPGQDSFWTWREAMYDMAARIEPDTLERCMGGLFLHMLRNGCTSCAEFHYLHHGPDGTAYANPAEMSERLVAAAQASGMALTLLPVFYQRSGFGAMQVLASQRRFASQVDGYLELFEACAKLAGEHPECAVGIAPHSLRAVPPDMLTEVLSGVPDDVPVHIHVAEQLREVEECLAALGARPVEWLLDQVELGPRWCLVHATHLQSGELRRAAETQAVAGLCPTTEADLGDGIFDAEDWLQAGGRFGIGTDSNLRVSVTEELRLLEFSQRLASGKRNVMADPERSCGRLLYEQAAAGGGQALGQPVGSIEAGRRADLVELYPDHAMLTGLEGDVLLDAYLFAGGRDMIRSVWVAGRRLLDEGRHADEAALDSGFATALAEMRSG